MSQRVSRRKLADTVAADLVAGKSVADVMERLAAYLVVENRTTESELIVRDIETALADRGKVIADVTTARPLTDKARKDLTAHLPTKNTEIREHVDPEVLGGVRLEFSGQRLDATLARKIETLTTLKI